MTNRLHERTLNTWEDATIRNRPSSCMNTIASAPARKDFQQYSCWLRCITRDGIEGANDDNTKACNFCQKANVDCIYFVFVDGIVAVKGVWVDGKVTKCFNQQRAHVDGKRERLVYRSP